MSTTAFTPKQALTVLPFPNGLSVSSYIKKINEVSAVRSMLGQVRSEFQSIQSQLESKVSVFLSDLFARLNSLYTEKKDLPLRNDFLSVLSIGELSPVGMTIEDVPNGRLWGCPTKSEVLSAYPT